MEAIIRHSGRQFKVKEGATINVDTQALEPGSQIEFGEVLYIGDDSTSLDLPEGGKERSTPRFGNPLLKGARVVGKVVGELRGPKLIAAQFRRRKNSRRRIGHRQTYTQVRIESIQG